MEIDPAIGFSPSSSGGHPTAVAMAHIVGGRGAISGVGPLLAQRFLFNNPQLLGKLFPHSFAPPSYAVISLSFLYADYSHGAVPPSLCPTSPLVRLLCLHLFLSNSSKLLISASSQTGQSPRLGIVIALSPVPLEELITYKTTCLMPMCRDKLENDFCLLHLCIYRPWFNFFLHTGYAINILYIDWKL